MKYKRNNVRKLSSCPPNIHTSLLPMTAVFSPRTAEEAPCLGKGPFDFFLLREKGEKGEKGKRERSGRKKRRKTKKKIILDESRKKKDKKTDKTTKTTKVFKQSKATTNKRDNIPVP